MTFYYTNSKLLTTLIIRVIPIVFFYYLALVMGDEIYIAVAILSLEAIVELLYMYKKGHAKIENGTILRHQFFSTKSVEIEDVHKVYVYDDEWTFRTHEKEVRIDLKLVRDSQREALTQSLEKFRDQIIARKKAA